MPDSPGERPAGTLHLSARHRAMLEALLQEHLPEVEVWAYGSRVNGESHDGSDLDLVLRGPGLAKIDISRLVDFEEALRDSTVPFLVEAHDWARLPESFHREIERRHVTLTERKNEDSVSEWRECTWGDLATLEYGRALRGYRSRKGPYRVFGTNGPIGWHTDALYNGPSVIVGRKGAYRGVHYAPDPFFVIDTAFYLKPKTEFDVRWAYYELLLHDINSMDTGSAIPSTSRDSFYDLPVRVPPLTEQREIAHILGTLDDKIELNRRMNETLEAMAWALFKSWFVDYEPVSAKQDGRDTGLPKDIADLFPVRFVASNNGAKVPYGWEVGTLANIVEIINGGTPRTSVPEYWDGDIPWYTAKDVPSFNGVFAIDTERTISQLGVANSSTRILPARTTIITARGTVGKVACLGIPMAMNQTCYGIRGHDGYPELFTYWNLRMSIKELTTRTHGTIFDTITRDTFTVATTIIPPTKVAAMFEDLVSPYMEGILANQNASRNLKAQRDALLPKLVSGELRGE